MSLFSKSGWEQLTHEGKVATATKLYDQAFQDAISGRMIPEQLFYQRIQGLLDNSDKPLSKFMNNNSWWFEPIVQSLEVKYNLPRNVMYGDIRPEEEEAFQYESNYTPLFIMIAIAVVFGISILIYKTRKQ